VNIVLGKVYCKESTGPVGSAASYAECSINESNGQLVAVGNTSPSLNAGVQNVSASALPVPTLSGSVCNNVITDTKFTVVYSIDDSGLKIASVVVDLTFGAASGSSLEQTFTIVYKQNTNPLDLSGNPGYLVGKPVLFGKLIQNGAR
jgi:hypothetical protein